MDSIFFHNSRHHFGPEKCGFLLQIISFLFFPRIQMIKWWYQTKYSFYFSVVKGMCYFPAAFQGEYVTQSIMSGLPAISYSTLSVAFDSIPVWGTCHKRIGNNVILMDDTGGLTCYKCFNLVLRSSNVLQIHTAGLDKCYTTEEKAVHDCPSDMMIRERRAREIMLYRKFFLFILFLFVFLHF